MTKKSFRPRINTPKLKKAFLKITKKEDRILEIGDLHEPFSLDGYLDHCKQVYAEYNCNKVVFIGDIIDNHYSSYHETDADGMGGGQELEFAISRIQRWYEAFPVADVIIGNHDRIISRKAQSGGIPRAWVRSYSEVLNTPKWNFTERVVYNNIQYVHGEAGTARTKSRADMMSTVQGHLHCVPLSYKVLTNNGWESLESVQVGAKVVGYNSKGEVEYTKVLHKKEGTHSGDMYKFNNKLLKQMVTSEHNMYTKNHEYLKIKDFLKEKTSNIVTDALPLKMKNEEEVYYDDFLRLIVAVCADGYMCRDNATPNPRFHIVKKRKVDRLNEIMANLGHGIEWANQAKGSFKSKGFSLEVRKMVADALPSKILPRFFRSLNSRQLAVVIEELPKWDGTVNDYNNVRQFSSTIKSELDFVQELLLLGGYMSKQYKNCISWITSKRGSSSIIGKQKGEWVSLKEPLPVGCITTEFQNFFIMTDDGTVELTGNTQMYTEWFVGAKFKVFGKQLGCGIDWEKYAFAYAKAGKKPAIGCGVTIGNHTSINVPMEL